MTEHEQWLVILAMWLAFFIWAPWYVTKLWRDRIKQIRKQYRQNEEETARRRMEHQRLITSLPADHYYDVVRDAVVTPAGECFDLRQFARQPHTQETGEPDG